jgi:plasmid stabilization system protein ParE
MAKLKIVWTETATIVFQQILTFYNVRNGNTQYSRSIYTMVRDVLQLVAKYPYMYKATSVPNIRVFHCDYFKVYYRVLEKQILVEAVFDTRKILIRLLFRGGFVSDGMERISVFHIICLSNQNVRYVSTH